MKLIYKLMLNKLYRKCNFDIQLFSKVIMEMKFPSDDEKKEFIEYIRKKRKDDD